MVFTGSNCATLGGGSQYTFSSLIIYDNNGYWDVQGSDTLTAKVFRFYSSGTGTFHIAGGGIVTLNDGFFYLTGGTLAGDGRSTINLYAPTSGDYKGIAIFSPVNNHTTFHVQGQSILNITGSILIPGSELLLDGSAVVTSLNSQVVCNDIVTGGSSSLTTTYKASQNYSGAGSSTLIDLNH